MFNLKKLLSVFVSAAMLSAALPLVVSAADDTESSGVVMYENDFNAPTVQEALPPVDNEYLTFGGYDSIEYKPLFRNGALTMNPGDGDAGRTLIFDFTKGGTKTGINKGVMYVGYDFAVRGKDDSYSVCKVGVNMNSHWDGGRMIYYDYNGWAPMPYIGDWPQATNVIDSDVHRYEYLFDFASQQVFMYVDGSLSFTWTNLSSDVNNFTISLNGDCLSLDNVKLLYYNELSLNASVSDISEERVRLSFNDGLATKSVLSNGATVKNIFTGEEFSAELVEVNDMLVDVVPENGFELGYGYEITLPKKLRGNCGGTLSDNTVEFSSALSNGLKTVSLKTLLGDTVKYSNENPAEVQSIIFEFTDDVSGKNALGGLSVTDSADNEVAFEIKGDGNVGEALLRGTLKGNEVYKITLEGLSVPYELEMKTSDGKLTFTLGKLYREDGITKIESLDEISAGETVVASYYAVNTSRDTAKYLSTIAMYNGKLMTGVNCKTDSLESGEKKETRFSFTVKDTTDLTFDGKIWDSEKTWPLTDKIEF